MPFRRSYGRRRTVGRSRGRSVSRGRRSFSRGRRSVGRRRGSTGRVHARYNPIGHRM